MASRAQTYRARPGHCRARPPPPALRVWRPRKAEEGRRNSRRPTRAQKKMAGHTRTRGRRRAPRRARRRAPARRAHRAAERRRAVAAAGAVRRRARRDAGDEARGAQRHVLQPAALRRAAAVAADGRRALGGVQGAGALSTPADRERRHRLLRRAAVDAAALGGVGAPPLAARAAPRNCAGRRRLDGPLGVRGGARRAAALLRREGEAGAPAEPLRADARARRRRARRAATC